MHSRGMCGELIIGSWLLVNAMRGGGESDMKLYYPMTKGQGQRQRSVCTLPRLNIRDKDMFYYTAIWCIWSVRTLFSNCCGGGFLWKDHRNAHQNLSSLSITWYCYFYLHDNYILIRDCWWWVECLHSINLATKQFNWTCQTPVHAPGTFDFNGLLCFRK